MTDNHQPDARQSRTTQLGAKPAVEARQGVMTGRVRWMLAISVTLTAAAFVIIYWIMR